MSQGAAQSTLRLPHPLRIAGLLLGAVSLVWMAFEDPDEHRAIILAVAFCAWAALRAAWNASTGSITSLIRHTLVFTLAGLSVAPLAALLMILKMGAHDHAIPDFTPQQFSAVLQRTPVWAVSGLLTGLGSGLWRWMRRA